MSNLLIDESPLVVSPTLAQLVGLNEAMFLQQLHWLLDKFGKEHDGHKWIFHTYPEWNEIFPFWDQRTIMRIVKKLKDRGLVGTTDKYNRMNSDRTLWYMINYEGLDKLSGPSCQSVMVEHDTLSLSAEYDKVSCSNSNKTTRPIESSPSVGEQKPAKPKNHKEPVEPRPRNPLFDAICHVCDLDPDHLPPDTKGSAVGKVMKDLKASKWQAGDVERYHAWRQAYNKGPLGSIHWLVGEMAKRDWRGMRAGEAESTVSDWIGS